VTGRSALDNGVMVVLQGDLTVYEARGQYQLIVRALEFQGAGALQVAFEKLKRKLDEAGYFDSERKRPLPRYSRRIGIVTSPTGAALQDILHVIERRHPSLEIVLAPCRVQGQGAAAEIADRIEQLNNWSDQQPDRHGLDLILATRGGGSLEDLWAFNEEIVAKAIFRSKLPVVSAVGHEIDFTISDFVADVRAATPSAAAEIITEGVYSSIGFIRDARSTLGRLMHRGFGERVDEYNELLRRLIRSQPTRKIQDLMQRLDDLNWSLNRNALGSIREVRQNLDFLLRRLAQIKPGERLRRLSDSNQSALNTLHTVFRHRLSEKRARLDQLAAELKLLSPDQTIARGYSITTDAETGELIRDHQKLKPGQMINTRVKSGTFTSNVNEPS
jgi:exodeoxyribonuclease VII large subunit